VKKTYKLAGVMKKMCATCPFREGGLPVEDLLVERALTQATPICHSTGPGHLKKQVSKKNLACRGARDLQLKVFAAFGFLDAPTDEEWSRKARSLGLAR